MFTGIIEEVGTIAAVEKSSDCGVLRVRAQTVLEDIHIGDSIAVNGVCLTVISYNQSGFAADVMHETFLRSALGRLGPGSRVNLERAMAANGRFGGHIVAGHIDGTGTIRSIRRDANAIWYTISAAPAVMKYIVEKGSIAIDGISLTVARADAFDFAVSIIPHTIARTALGDKKTGDMVNLENDIIGKYVEKFLNFEAPSGKTRGITKEMLEKYGF